jgi:hypothetical protein
VTLSLQRHCNLEVISLLSDYSSSKKFNSR